MKIVNIKAYYLYKIDVVYGPIIIANHEIIYKHGTKNLK